MCGVPTPYYRGQVGSYHNSYVEKAMLYIHNHRHYNMSDKDPKSNVPGTQGKSDQ